MYYVEYWETENEPSYASFPVLEDVVGFIRTKLQEDSSLCVRDFRVIHEQDLSAKDLLEEYN